MYKPVNAIEVRIWGRRVGAVALDPALGLSFVKDRPGNSPQPTT